MSDVRIYAAFMFFCTHNSLQQLSVPALAHMLTVACETAEQESHGVSFEGATSADVMERLRRYIEVRKRFHCRNAKRASLTGQK